MFVPGRWAAAFVDSQGGDIEEGLNALVALTAWVKSLSGAIFGSSSAEKIEKLIREGIAESGTPPATETALRLVVLMVRKNVFRHIDPVIDEIKKILDKRNGIVQGSLEYAFPPEEDDISRIKEAIKKRTGAARVNLTEQMNTELVGGFRLRIEDEIIDASIRSQLRKLETCLAEGIFDGDGDSAGNPGNGGN